MILFKHNRFFVTIFGLGQPKPRRRNLSWRVGIAKPKTSQSSMLEITLTNEQKVTVTLSPVTESGRPAKLDGAPSWSVTSGEGQVLPAEDGLSAVLVSSDNPGDTEIMVQADADLGAGVETISDVIRLHVEGARASHLGLVAGNPEPK
jgi:hypothetical protein